MARIRRFGGPYTARRPPDIDEYLKKKKKKVQLNIFNPPAPTLTPQFYKHMVHRPQPN